ncbi:MAG: transketolase C-terminal domain-containing protein [Verrucomicrobiales bacterium]
MPLLSGAAGAEKREGVRRGGYVLVKESAPLEAILLASGSEVQHAAAAAGDLGPGVRVVSIPCMERFDRQGEAYRHEVLPPDCQKRVAIEAGVGGLWWKYVGTAGKVIGIERFGISAPGDTVMEELGMTAANVVETIKSLG